MTALPGLAAAADRAAAGEGATLERHAFIGAPGAMPATVQAQAFLRDGDSLAAMNEADAAFRPPAPPARATVEVAGLPRGARAEIMPSAAR